MAVRYRTFDGEKVSRQWHRLLTDIREHEHGLWFHLNEGHRTIARQWEFWRLFKAGKGPIAAFPSPIAPHIRTGRADHACDFNNAEGVRRAAGRRGVTLTRTVLWPNGTVREEWHLEANRAELRRYARRRAREIRQAKRQRATR